MEWSRCKYIYHTHFYILQIADKKINVHLKQNLVYYTPDIIGRFKKIYSFLNMIYFSPV